MEVYFLAIIWADYSSNGVNLLNQGFQILSESRLLVWAEQMLIFKFFFK